MASGRVINLARFLGKAAEPAAAAHSSALHYSTVGGVAAYKLPDLPYAHSALEPVISGRLTSTLHSTCAVPHAFPVHNALNILRNALALLHATPMLPGEIMELHHKKHHATYVTNLNKALEEYAEAESKQDLQKMISLQGAINFNGGGAHG
jgi:superoxide dismutase